MRKVIYSNNYGVGVILDAGEQEADFMLPKAMMIVDEVMMPGDMTMLGGLFNKPVRYAGVLKDDERCMCFYMGPSDDGKVTYYSCFFWITELRLANKYSERTCRDFHWKGGRFK